MDTANNQTEAVKSMGNAWIICRSKSHPDHIYYFNTLTGEAAWNLSETEIEKAKRTTKMLEIQPGSTLDRCPEPQGPPIAAVRIVVQNTPRPPIHLTKTYDKQIVNNGPKLSNNLTQSDEYALTSTSVMKPSFHSRYRTMSPNTWAFPDSAATTFRTSTVSQMETTANPQYDWNRDIKPRDIDVKQYDFDGNISLQNTALPMTKRFEMCNSAMNSNSMSNSNSNDGRRYFHQTTFDKKTLDFNPRMRENNQYMGDLRQKLSSMRKNYKNFTYTGSSAYEGSEYDEVCGNAQVEPVTLPRFDDLSMSFSDKDSNCSSMCIKNPLKLCLKPLKDLAIAEANPSYWYIVPDTNVLLENLNYLNMLTKADENCRLLIPQFVMMNLQSIAFSSNDSKFHARNVIRLLTQQFDAGSAEIGSMVSSQIENKESAQIFNCCRNLAEQNNHVILISNSKDMLRYKYTTRIPIFTLEEVKSLLSIESFSNQSTPKPFGDTLQEKTYQDESTSKLVVNNNVNENIIGIKHFTANNEKKYDSEYRVCKSNEASKSSDIDMESSCKVDAGVQTDLFTSFIEVKSDSHVMTSTTPVMSCSLIKISSGDSNRKSNEVANNATCKKRVIRLKRNKISPKCQDDPNNTASERIQSKWRKRKNPCTTEEENKSNTVNEGSESKEAEEVEKIDASFVEKVLSPKKNPANYLLDKQNISDIIDDGITAGSDSSCSIQRNVSGKIFIEETSTSGAISNTESNVDTESIISVKPKLLGISPQQTQTTKQNVAKNIFKVSNPTMEECLHMKRDEWIFRFDQIMEDVLTEVLQQTPKFVDQKYRPPWTLPEATNCIAIKFRKEPQVVVAAEKLADILLRISNIHGGINKHFEPSEYMEMYSYGVHLVEALQEVCNYDGLKVAVESLSKLLKDIQNPTQDGGPNDTFTDIQDSSYIKSADKYIDYGDLTMKTPTKTASDVVKYSSRSNKNSVEKEKESPQQVKFVRNINISYSFFDALNLRRKSYEKAIVPKACPKGATRSELNYYPGNESELDYEEDFEEEEFSSEKENSDQENHIESVEQEIKPDVNEQKLKYFIGLFLQRIRTTFLSVEHVCEKYYDDIKNNQLKEAEKIKMRVKAEQAQEHLELLCQSLNSILQRENGQDTIQNLLKNADIDFVLDDDMSSEYRLIVQKCKEQADSVLSSIRFILSMS